MVVKTVVTIKEIVLSSKACINNKRIVRRCVVIRTDGLSRFLKNT